MAGSVMSSLYELRAKNAKHTRRKSSNKNISLNQTKCWHITKGTQFSYPHEQLSPKNKNRLQLVEVASFKSINNQVRKRKHNRTILAHSFPIILRGDISAYSLGHKLCCFALLFETFLSPINHVLHSRCGEEMQTGRSSCKENVIVWF